MIHTVGPVWHGGAADEERLLASCYRNSLLLAADHGLQSIAFPAISTGVYAFPPDRAARIAVGTVVSEISADPRGIARVVFCCFGETSAQHHLMPSPEIGHRLSRSAAFAPPVRERLARNAPNSVDRRGRYRT